VHLVPHDGAAHPRLVLDDGFDRGAFLLQHELLVPRRYVGFAPGRKRLPVHQVFLRAGLREGRGGQGESEYGKQSRHGGIVLLSCLSKCTREPPPPGTAHAAATLYPGMRMRATRPPPSRASSSNLPRCARTTRSTMARPRPAPPLSLRATSRRVN